jgi:hypothetical protein
MSDGCLPSSFSWVIPTCFPRTTSYMNSYQLHVLGKCARSCWKSKQSCGRDMREGCQDLQGPHRVHTMRMRTRVRIHTHTHTHTLSHTHTHTHTNTHTHTHTHTHIHTHTHTHTRHTRTHAERGEGSGRNRESGTQMSVGTRGLGNEYTSEGATGLRQWEKERERPKPCQPPSVSYWTPEIPHLPCKKGL